jgi:hypothetical protein
LDVEPLAVPRNLMNAEKFKKLRDLRVSSGSWNFEPTSISRKEVYQEIQELLRCKLLGDQNTIMDYEGNLLKTWKMNA